MTGDGLLPGPDPVEEPVPGGPGVGQGLLGRERLGRHHDEGLRRIEVVGLGVQVHRVDVRHEPALDVRVGEVAQRLMGHGRPEVRTADPDVDHRSDPSSGRPGPLTRSDPVGHRSHPVEYLVDVGHHVAPVHHELAVAGHPERNVEDRTVLRRIDPLTREHRVPSFRNAGPGGHCHQGIEGAGVDPVLGVVEDQVPGASGHGGAARRVGGEQVAKVTGAKSLEVRDEVLPFRGTDEVDNALPFPCVGIRVHGHSPPCSSRCRGRHRPCTPDCRHPPSGIGENWRMITVR